MLLQVDTYSGIIASAVTAAVTVIAAFVTVKTMIAKMEVRIQNLEENLKSLATDRKSDIIEMKHSIAEMNGLLGDIRVQLASKMGIDIYGQKEQRAYIMKHLINFIYLNWKVIASFLILLASILYIATHILYK